MQAAGSRRSFFKNLFLIYFGHTSADCMTCLLAPITHMNMYLHHHHHHHQVSPRNEVLFIARCDLRLSPRWWDHLGGSESCILVLCRAPGGLCESVTPRVIFHSITIKHSREGLQYSWEGGGARAAGREVGGGEGCTNTSRVLGDARCVVCGNVTDITSPGDVSRRQTEPDKRFSMTSTLDCW